MKRRFPFFSLLENEEDRRDLTTDFTDFTDENSKNTIRQKNGRDRVSTFSALNLFLVSFRPGNPKSKIQNRKFGNSSPYKPLHFHPHYTRLCGRSAVRYKLDDSRKCRFASDVPSWLGNSSMK
jgi:hypothetical protein